MRRAEGIRLSTRWAPRDRTQVPRTGLSGKTQAFVTLSTHQLESVQAAICCVDVSTAMHELRTLRERADGRR